MNLKNLPGHKRQEKSEGCHRLKINRGDVRNKCTVETEDNKRTLVVKLEDF